VTSWSDKEVGVGSPGAVSIVNERNYARVQRLIEDATSKGAQLVNAAPDSETDTPPDRERRMIPPTVLLDVTPEMSISSEEVFGPVLVVLPYDEMSAVVNYVASRPTPLAAYWFGEADDEFDLFLNRTNSGGVSRNDIAVHWSVNGAPSGGIGRSGIGSYSGKFGFDTFSHHRAVSSSERAVGTGSMMIPSALDAVGDGLRQVISDTLGQLHTRIDGTAPKLNP
jgi:coniferyl-aldehyde dehydrogenase